MRTHPRQLRKKRHSGKRNPKGSPLLASLVFGSLILHSLLIFFPFLAFYTLPALSDFSSTPASKVTAPSSTPVQPYREETPPRTEKPPVPLLEKEISLKTVREEKREIEQIPYHPSRHPREKSSLFSKEGPLPQIDRFSCRASLASKVKIRHPKKKRVAKKSPPKKNFLVTKAPSQPKARSPIKSTGQNQGHPDAPLQVVYRVKHYPSRCRRRNHEGQVVLEVWIDEGGICQKVRILSSSEGCCSRLVDAAGESARESRYQPGWQLGKKVGGWKKLEYTFRLR